MNATDLGLHNTRKDTRKYRNTNSMTLEPQPRLNAENLPGAYRRPVRIII